MRLYLHRPDIETLNAVSDKQALRIMQNIREEFGLPKTRYISVKAYCEYFMVERDDVLQTLNLRHAS